MGQADRGRRSEDELTVEAVYDLRHNPDESPIHAATFLDALSEAEWSELRAIATRTGKTENPLLRCGDCGKAVYGRESWKGRRHFYHFGGDHSDCRWAGAVAENVRSIDAAKFHGQQEGERHKQLCRYVREALSLDASTLGTGIQLARYTKHDDGRYAYPDVFAANWQGGPAAFEIQLATTHLPVIARREDFYKDARVRLVWIVGYHAEGLNRRAFRDIHMRNDGQILGMDGEVIAAARAADAPRFRLYRLLPGNPFDGFAPHWRNRIVAPEDIDWGEAGDRPRSVQPSYDSYLNQRIEQNTTLSPLRHEFYESLKRADEAGARSAWDKVATITGGLRWNALASSYDDVRALGVLATIRTGEPHVPSRIDPDNLPHLVNSMLLEPPGRRCWTHGFELLCRAKGMGQLLWRPKVREKCDRNYREAGPGIPLDRSAGAVFNVFFPEGAFQRISFDDD